MLLRQDVTEALSESGLCIGDTVLVQSNLSLFGRIQGLREKTKILEFFYSAFWEVLGSEGTLVVLTAFEDYARKGEAFHRNKSPSLSGSFSEYVRLQPGAVRSIHPVLSLSAVGKNAGFLCSGSHYEGFGYDSAWGRLHRLDAKLITFGYGIRPDGMTFLHYLENLYGVPYQYTKVFDYPVYDEGKLLEGVFTMPVRFLDFEIENDQSSFKRYLLERKAARLVKCGRGEIFGSNCSSVIDNGIVFLRNNRYGLLKKVPSFRRGEIPFDLDQREELR